MIPHRLNHPIKATPTREGQRCFQVLLVLLVAIACAKKDESEGGGGPSSRGEAIPLAELPRLTTAEGRIAEGQRQLDLAAATSGWETERLAAAAGDVLAQLGALLTGEDPIAEAALVEIIAEGYTGSRPRPEGLATVFRNAAVEVRGPPPTGFGEQFAGRESAAAAFEALRAVTANSELSFKIVSVRSRGGEPVELDVVFESRAVGARQIGGRWATAWERRPDDAVQLVSLAPQTYQEAIAIGDGGVWFADATHAVLGGVSAFPEQLAHGLAHWLRRIERVHGMLYFKRHGLAVGDADGDGLDDVYLCQAGGLPNRLFLQNPDGTVRDASGEAGVDIMDNTAAALLVDLDNDGDQDLALATFEGIVLLANNGAARFERRGLLSTADTDLHGLSAVDYDLDGDLDLYVLADFAERGSRPGERAPRFRYHDANDGGANLLFRNETSEGGWKFADATAASGLDVHNRRHSLAASWEDFDLDGDPDLYVANDYGQNCLYRNDADADGPGWRFNEVAAESGLVDFGSGMSVSWGDFDRDGFADLYVGNMFSAAGRRITEQARFLSGSDDARRALYGRFAKGNSLFRGLGGGEFAEITGAAGAERGRWAWSSPFADLDNDGWEDLVVANGYISGPDPGDL